MAFFEFNPFDTSVIVKFNCPQCGTPNETETLCVPTPDLSADTHDESSRQEYYEHICPNCGRTFNIILSSGICGGDGEITEIDDTENFSIIENFPDDNLELSEDSNEYVDEYVKDTINALNEINTSPLSSEVRGLLYRVLYANLISCMEAYLGNQFKRMIFLDEHIKQCFVEKYPVFCKEKIPLSKLFDIIRNIDARIKEELNKIIYHRLDCVKKLYKDILDIDLGDISTLMKSVSIRHDIVHRNGVNKDGEEHHINEGDVKTLAYNVSSLIERIKDTQLDNMLKDVIEA